VPTEDRQLAVALLMELAIQRGSLSAMLSAVHHLLTVSSDVVDVDRDNRLSTVLTHAPLVPVLRRFQALALPSEAIDCSDVSEVIHFFLKLLILYGMQNDNYRYFTYIILLSGVDKYVPVSYNQKAAITSQWWRRLVNAYEVKAVMVCLHCKNCVIHTRALHW